MIFTDYYRFEKLPNQRSMHRIDCTDSSHSYNILEAMRNKEGDLFLYIGKNNHTKAGVERKSDLALSKTDHISSIYNPDMTLPYWYGDVKGTSDAFLIAHNDVKFDKDYRIQAGSILELFIARGQRHNQATLYNAVCDGELDEEMNALRIQVAEADKR